MRSVDRRRPGHVKVGAPERTTVSVDGQHTSQRRGHRARVAATLGPFPLPRPEAVNVRN